MTIVVRIYLSFLIYTHLKGGPVKWANPSGDDSLVKPWLKMSEWEGSILNTHCDTGCL